MIGSPGRNVSSSKKLLLPVEPDTERLTTRRPHLNISHYNHANRAEIVELFRLTFTESAGRVEGDQVVGRGTHRLVAGQRVSAHES